MVFRLRILFRYHLTHVHRWLIKENIQEGNNKKRKKHSRGAGEAENFRSYRSCGIWIYPGEGGEVQQ